MSVAPRKARGYRTVDLKVDGYSRKGRQLTVTTAGSASRPSQPRQAGPSSAADGYTINIASP
jgi:hypothetical protein